MLEELQGNAVEVLQYFYLKYNGNDKEVRRAIKEREDIDYSDFERLIEVPETSKRHLITILDDAYYPSCLKERKGPLVIELTFWRQTDSGLVSIDDSKINTEMLASLKRTIEADCKSPESYVGIEGSYDKIVESFKSHKLKVATVFIPDHLPGDSMVFVEAWIDENKVIRIPMPSAAAAYELLGVISGKMLAINGTADLIAGIKKYNEIHKKDKLLFAVPGKSGCYCNLLIKKGEARLCDTWQDLVMEEK